MAENRMDHVRGLISNVIDTAGKMQQPVVIAYVIDAAQPLRNMQFNLALSTGVRKIDILAAAQSLVRLVIENEDSCDERYVEIAREANVALARIGTAATQFQNQIEAMKKH